MDVFSTLNFSKAVDFSMKDMISFPGDVGVHDSQMFSDVPRRLTQRMK